ncbi:ASCH domain-containing protein [Oxalobacteraceae bacterium CAVE-383]|nr:ASCH domain-containing protein [Oxalobacteraceae bacterium CAVE-383]
MSLFPKSSPPPSGRIVLLSIKPKYAELILAGSKRVEFRRSWAAQEVTKIVLYSSSPIQKIVGIVEVEDVVTASATTLWKTCVERGGGLTREELRSYFSGKSQGFGLLLGNVLEFANSIEPSEIIKNFVPPQSFRYLDNSDYINLEKFFATKSEKQ